MAGIRSSSAAVAVAALCLACCTGNDTGVAPKQTEAASQPDLAQNIPTVQHRTVITGRRFNVSFMSRLGADCQSIGTVGSYLLRAPQHGTVLALPGDGHPTFPPDNPRSACNRRLVPGLFVTYRSEPYYDGSDEFQMLFALDGDREARVTYVIQVQSPAAFLKPMPNLAH